MHLFCFTNTSFATFIPIPIPIPHQNIDYRVEFSKWFQQEFRTVKFPTGGTVFDYFIERESLRFAPWSEKIPKFELDPDTPLQVRSSLA